MYASVEPERHGMPIQAGRRLRFARKAEVGVPAGFLRQLGANL